MDISFKNICLNATKSFELVDKLKLLRDELIELNKTEEELINNKNLEVEKEDELAKLTKLKLRKRTDIENKCIELKSSVEFINNKKSLNLIKTKLNKRKYEQKTSTSIFYHNELENLLRNKKDLFWENTHPQQQEKNNSNPDEISSFESKIAHHQLLDQLNSQLNDLKKLRELLLIYLKLITIRMQHKQIESNPNINKLNELLTQIDNRKLTYENEKKRLKEEIKLANLNSIKYEQFKKKENLNKHLNAIENSIKEYLFGPIKNSNFNTLFYLLFFFEVYINLKIKVNEANSFELYQRQAESSIQNLILIRQEWDNFVSDSFKAESLPVDWVYVDSLSNDKEWAKFARTNNSSE